MRASYLVPRLVLAEVWHKSDVPTRKTKTTEKTDKRAKRDRSGDSGEGGNVTNIARGAGRTRRLGITLDLV